MNGEHFEFFFNCLFDFMDCLNYFSFYVFNFDECIKIIYVIFLFIYNRIEVKFKVFFLFW